MLKLLRRAAVMIVTPLRATIANAVHVFRQFRLSFLPPMMIYLAFGAAAVTGIVETFFAKDYLSVSPEFLAGVLFWAAVPWLLKVPLGHFVDVIWKWKSLLVFVGAGAIAASFLIMYGLIG